MGFQFSRAGLAYGIIESYGLSSPPSPQGSPSPRAVLHNPNHLFPDLPATLLFPLHRFAFCACHHEGAIVGRIAFLREGLLDG